MTNGYHLHIFQVFHLTDNIRGHHSTNIFQLFIVKVVSINPEHGACTENLTIKSNLLNFQEYFGPFRVLRHITVAYAEERDFSTSVH